MIQFNKLRWFGFIIIGIILSYGIFKLFQEEPTISTPIIIIEEKKDTLYDFVINKIKDFEKFKSKEYNCITTQRLIGYGHAIKKGENLSNLTEEQADSLLREDFNKSINLAYKHTKIEEKHKIYAIAHFIFNIGVTKFNKSTFKKKVLKGEDITKELLKWNKIVISEDSIIESTHLTKRRQFEINLYYGFLTHR